MNNLKISNFGKKFVSTVAAIFTLSAPLVQEAKAITPPGPTTSTVTTVSGDVTTTTTYVSYEGDEVYNNKKDADAQIQKYYDIQEGIRKDVIARGGNYNYTVDSSESVIVNPDVTIIVDEADPNKVGQLIDEEKAKLSNNAKVTEVIVTPIKKDVEELVNEQFAAKELAEAKLTEFKTKVEANGGAITESSITEKYIDSTKTKTTDAYTDLTLEEAENLKASLEASDGDEHDFVITATIRSYDKDTGRDEIIILSKTFATKGEAEKYLTDLKNQGYTITSSEIKLNQSETDVSFSNTYETYEEALQALNEFKATHNNATGEITETRDETEDTLISSETGTTPYDTLEQAEAAAALITGDHDTKIIVSIRKGTTEISSKIEDVITQEFATEQEVLDAIALLKAQGYIVDDYTIVKKGNGLTGMVETGGKHDNSSDTYQFDLTTTNFVLIKQGSGKVAVWTETPMSATEQQSFITSYNNKNNFDGSTTGRTLENTVFISGLTTFDLQSEEYGLGGNWGTEYTFSKEGDILTLKIPSRQVSHTVYGYIEEKNISYLAKGIMHTVKPVYYIDQQKYRKGYDYSVSANGKAPAQSYSLTGEAKKDIYEKRYALDIEKETKNYKYDLNAKGKYPQTAGFKLVFKNQSSTYKVITKGNGSYGERKNPKTGVEEEYEDNYDLYLGGSVLGAAALGLATNALVRRRKK